MKETGWIIFFDYKKTRYYFVKFRLERCVFKTDTFCLYETASNANDDFIKIEESLKLYGNAIMSKYGIQKLKLKIAHVNVTET